MNRRNLIKNGILALCSTLLPEILRPMDFDVKQKFLIWEAGNFYYDANKVVKYEKAGDGRWMVYYNGYTDGKFPIQK